MGTISEWLSVVVWGGVWAAAMLWASASKNFAFLNFKSRFHYVATWGSAGLLFGIMTTFGWHRAIQVPLLFVTVAAFAGIVLSPLFYRGQTRH